VKSSDSRWNISIQTVCVEYYYCSNSKWIVGVDYIYYNGSKWNVSILGGLQCVSILHYIYVSIPVVTRQITTIAIILGQISIFQLFSSESW